MEFISNCPVCGHPSFNEYLKTKDYFLNKDEFTIVFCERCGFRFTNPRPDSHEILSYYESNAYVSHNAQKQNLLNFIYRKVRSFSIKRKFSLVKKVNDGRTLLDIGCGTGEFIAYCSKKGFTTTGVEPNENARKFANESLHQNVKPESFFEEDFQAKFAIITLWHALEHIHDLNGRLKKIATLLKPSGSLIIAVPNSNSPDAIHYREFWAAYDLPRHLYHFTPDTLKKAALKHGFRIKEIIPLKFDAYYISLLSEKYKYGRENYLRAFFNGIKSNRNARKTKENYSSLIYILKHA
jgi:2-polyprenyl-3-methyl-5-hydroxy-6-metoxy-1,4-benzoquinol methylase